MKRKAEDDLNEDQKRQKPTGAPLEEPNTDPFTGLTPVDGATIHKDGPNDNAYIPATVFMQWRPTNKKYRIYVETKSMQDPNVKHKFEVCFSGKCVGFWHQLEMKPTENILLSLKGCKMEALSAPLKSCTLPMKLNFEDGVMVKFMKKGGVVIDTWTYRAPSPVDDWFSTPATVPRGQVPLVAQLTGKEHHAVQPEDVSSRRPTEATSASATQRATRPMPRPIFNRANGVQDTKMEPSGKENAAARPLSVSVGEKQNTIQEKPTSRSSSVTRSIHVPKAISIPTPVNNATSTMQSDANARRTHPLPDNTNNVKPVKDQLSASVALDQQAKSTGSGAHKAPTIPEADGGEQQVQPMSKKQQKRLRQAAQQQENKKKAASDCQPFKGDNAQGSVPAPDDTKTSVPETLARKSAPLEQPVPEAQSHSVSGQGLPANAKNSAAPASSRQNAPVDPLQLKAGFRSSEMVYAALGSLKEGQVANFAGVVAHATPPAKTKTGDWTVNLKVADSSTISEVSDGVDGFFTNVFTKKYREWLPCVSVGDIIVMRQIKVVNYQGMTRGVGYHGKYQWALYNPKTKEFHHGPPNSAPRQERLAGDHGVLYSPFWIPAQKERTYCDGLAEWWQALAKQKGFSSQASDEQHAYSYGGVLSSSAGRQYRLICDAGPDVPPQGYFNCTAEVLYGHKNDNGVFSLYVTDYTSNSSAPPCQTNWCPTYLSDYVLKIEMWDAASELGPAMILGEVYTIKNVRMKTSLGGYLEGKVTEKKIDIAQKSDPRLEALLARKKSLQEANPKEVKGEFEHMLFNEALVDKHFNCTVELLKSVYDEKGDSYVYVTDYTHCPEYAAKDASGDWLAGLEDYVVKIILADEQAELTKVLVPGYFKVSRLRLKQSNYYSFVMGRLGGPQRNINRLNPKTPDEKELEELLQRKEKWQKDRQSPQVPMVPDKVETAGTSSEAKNADARAHDVPKPGTDQSKATSSELATPDGESYDQPCCTIKEIQDCEEQVGKFRVAAKVVDFYPLKLEDCIVATCTKCKKKIPPHCLACVECVDLDHEYVKCAVDFFLMLQDEEGNTIKASVSNGADLLRDIDRNLNRAVIYPKLRNILDPILGNLPAVHKALTSGEQVDVKTDMFYFVVVTWPMEGSGKAYYVFNCEGRAKRV